MGTVTVFDEGMFQNNVLRHYNSSTKPENLEENYSS